MTSPISFRRLAACIVALAMGGTVLRAQQLIGETAAPADANTHQIVPTPSTETGSPVIEDVTPNQGGDFGGKIPFKVSLNVRAIYDDNIYITHNNRVDDYYWAISPKLTYETSDLANEPQNYFHFAYEPTFFEFMNHSNNNSIDHNAVANYQLDLDRLKLGADLSFLTDHTPNVDFGGRVDSTYYGARLFAKYELTGRLTLDASAATTISRYQIGNDTDEYSGSLYLDYAYSPKTTIGFGTTSGYINVSGKNPDINYQQANGRVSYQITEKFSLLATGGIDIREYSGNGTTLNPNLSAAANYTPFDSTLVQLNSGIRTVPSISLAGQDYNDYTTGFLVRQRLLGKIYLGFAFNYEHADYFSVGPTPTPAGRSFDYLTERPSVNWTCNDFLTLGAYYERQDNMTPTAFTPYEFSVNSVGLTASVAY